jgi:hypothetical protein
MTKCRLTRAQLEGVAQAAADGDGVEGFLKLWEILLGKPLGEVDGPVVPGDYRLPERQAAEVLRRIGEGASADHRMGLGLLWVNKGPGTYEEEVS